MALHPQPPPTGRVTTTVLINNIHCASCLSYIDEANNQPSEKHIEHCVACQKSSEKVEIFKDVTVTIPEARKFTAALSIAGMTCAACILSINEGVQELKFLEDVSVSLLTNSATVTFAGPKENIDQIVERIEDRGYGCHVEHVVEVDGSQEGDEQAERTVMIRIAGMFCGHCPQRVVEALSLSFRGLLVINKAPSHEDPIMTIIYHPQHGIVTIRDILTTIHGVSDQLKATIYHPPTIEERSRAMQLRERRRLLLRLLLSFVVAIPTFLISVVWMSLVPSTNHVRMFFQGKMWVGADTRGEWALFFLATPVMFFVADVFHVRAIKEVRALWGRNSTVPILRRFYRFGSMNLLMSTGTSVAYFPSIAVLALDSRKTSQSKGQVSTYFDAVVFLTMFILAGRYLEAYSKAQTGDAVTMLGKLRPTEAVLVRPDPDIGDTSEGSQPSLPITNVEKINVDLLEVPVFFR